MPRPEEVDVRRSAKAHCVPSSRWSRACDNLQNEPNRHASDRRIGNVYELMMHSKAKAPRVVLTCTLENAGQAAG
jgi:hypothetical protein